MSIVIVCTNSIVNHHCLLLPYCLFAGVMFYFQRKWPRGTNLNSGSDWSVGKLNIENTVSNKRLTGCSDATNGCVSKNKWAIIIGEDTRHHSPEPPSLKPTWHTLSYFPFVSNFPHSPQTRTFFLVKSCPFQAPCSRISVLSVLLPFPFLLPLHLSLLRQILRMYVDPEC